MKYKSTISYLLIILGGSIAIYANANEKQNTILLVLGIFALMYGLYRISSSLSSRPSKDDYKVRDEEE